jgi:hypothetical protein
LCGVADDWPRICPKLDDAGKLKQEMILVWCVVRFHSWFSKVYPLTWWNSNAIRNDLVRTLAKGGMSDADE